MYNDNFKLREKGLRAIAIVIAVLCCLMTLGTRAFADPETQTLELDASGSEARLIMDFPQAAAEKIASMQISLVVLPSSGADIEFIPDSGLPAKIVESRYHSDTGVLTVYLAGTKALFSGASPLTVGRIRIGGTNVSAAVKVEEGSIKFVRGSELVTPSGDVSYPEPVTISTGGAAMSIPPDFASATTSSNTASSASGTSSSQSPQSETQDDPGFEPVEPADTSSLEEAVERAESFKRGDYTEESFATLTDALNKARSTLENKSSTQEEVDEALLVLENAIGMLASTHTAPSGTESYGITDDENGASVSANSGSSNNNGGSGSPDNSLGSSAETFENTSDSGASGTSKTGSSGTNKSAVSPVIPIIIVAAVLAAAAFVVAFKLNKNKNKNKNKNNNKSNNNKK